jgi:hypothetical protein
MQVAVGSQEWFRSSLVGSSPLSGLDRTGCSCISNVNKDLQYTLSAKLLFLKTPLSLERNKKLEELLLATHEEHYREVNSSRGYHFKFFLLLRRLHR